VRTGADAFEAFCLGAKAVLVGRPYVYGLALAGKEGVRDVIGDLAADIDLTLGLAGHRCLTNHKTPLIHRWLTKRPRYHLHFTPTSATWLNRVESWFALLTARQLRRGTFRSTRALEQAIRAYIAGTNQDPTPFLRTKPANDILASVQRLCQRISNSCH
jgi:hypothetical protein